MHANLRPKMHFPSDWRNHQDREEQEPIRCPSLNRFRFHSPLLGEPLDWSQQAFQSVFRTFFIIIDCFRFDGNVCDWVDEFQSDFAAPIAQYVVGEMRRSRWFFSKTSNGRTSLLPWAGHPISIWLCRITFHSENACVMSSSRTRTPSKLSFQRIHAVDNTTPFIV